MELQVNPKLPTLMILGRKAEGALMPSQIAWLRQSDEDRSKSRNVQQKLLAAGLDVLEVDPESETLKKIQSADLIIIEDYGQSHRNLSSLLHQVRIHSHAPVVMLTDNQTFDWSSSAIAAGADAIVTIATADEVIIARCQALLRRWRAGQ
jgi:DNA-binding response OmpR family regulator